MVSHSKKLTKKNKEQLSDMMMLNKQKGGLKALSKEKREKLEAYQHLFYLLQVRGSWDRVGNLADCLLAGMPGPDPSGNEAYVKGYRVFLLYIIILDVLQSMILGGERSRCFNPR